MEDYLFQKFNTAVWKTAKKKERKEMSTKTMMQSEKKMGVRAVVQIGMLAAVAVILMLFEIPLPFAPSFYKIDFSEVPQEIEHPVLVGCFAMGPVAGALIELVKILLNFVLTGTSTAGVGEIANFVIGCALCVPAGIIYRRNRTRKNALIGMATGTILMTVLGCFVNAYVLLPAYGAAFGMPVSKLVGLGTAVNPHITSLSTFVIFAVAPFNLIKGVAVSAIVFVIYKKISPVLRMR